VLWERERLVRERWMVTTLEPARAGQHTTQEEHDMRRTNALAITLATVLMATAANAGGPPRDVIQAPRGQETQAPRGQETQAPRGQETQAPRGQEEQAPRR
jgi:hypothetical protein